MILAAELTDEALAGAGSLCVAVCAFDHDAGAGQVVAARKPAMQPPHAPDSDGDDHGADADDAL